MNNENELPLIQIPDSPNSDVGLTEYYEFEQITFSADQFVIIQDQMARREYLGQIVGPQINLNRDALGPHDMTTINQFEALKRRYYSRDVVINEIHLWRIKILREISTGTPLSVRQRPGIGSEARAAGETEVVNYLNMPEIRQNLQLGNIIDTSIPICMNKKTLLHHVLLAGATGSGKSNLVVNLVRAAQQLGFCVILYDHKPDFQHIDQSNDESTTGKGIPNVKYWHLNINGINNGQRIAVFPSELDPAVLAATICYQPRTELNSAEVLTTILTQYRDEQLDNNNPRWTMDDFLKFLPAECAEAKVRFGMAIDSRTYATMLSRLKRTGRIPNWIMRGNNRDISVLKPNGFSLEREVSPGKVLVIKTTGATGGRGYGLFLSYLLSAAAELRENNNHVPILHIADEAQRIFDAGQAFHEAIGGKLDEKLREGRSLQIGFVFSVQSADAVPESIRNNLNSQFIFAHNNHDQAREAMARATKDQLIMTDSFGPGECLVSLFQSTAVIHARLLRSDAMLDKPPPEQ